MTRRLLILFFLLLTAFGFKQSLEGEGVDLHESSVELSSESCPTGFIPAPSLEGYTTNDFCVAKYEMKDDGSGGAISKAQGTPYVRINRNDAITKCQEIGSGYDLITNDEWQSLARNIEMVRENWEESTIGLKKINQGHSDYHPRQTLAASEDDNEGCHGTGQSCNNQTWIHQKRTHTLTNGEVIWDLSGNVWEWVKDDNNVNYGKNAFMSRVTTQSHTTFGQLSGGTTTTSRQAKDQFGPQGNYTRLLSNDRFGGLGRGRLNYKNGAIRRGGAKKSRRRAGIFAVRLNNSETNKNSVTGFRCVYRPSEEDSEETSGVSIDRETLENISSANASNFTIDGSCSAEGQEVLVNVGGIRAQANCSLHTWSVEMDVTGLNKVSGSISIEVKHSSADGQRTSQDSESVTNDFVCPEHFVAIPSLKGYTTHSFCVAKYEMKNNGSNQAVSQATGLPYTNFTRDDSIAKCTAMGTGYDMITNDEWQSLARNIELVSNNWSGGTVGSGTLNRGHCDHFPDVPLAASSNDEQGCFGTEEICQGRHDWHDQKRTHNLSNGEIIWDLSGNAWEWVKDDNSFNYGSNAYISQVTKTSHTLAGRLSGGTTTTARAAKDQFGPSGNYSSLNSGIYGGLGHGWLAHTGGAVLRGGFWSFFSSDPHVGVFSVSLKRSASESNEAFGFRCTYHP